MVSPAVTGSAEAADAAVRAGVEVRELEAIGELAEADRLFADIWGGGSQDAMASNLMRALGHSGNYVAGAFAAGRLIGASVGFVWAGRPALHSHISGVAPEVQGGGVGYALKLHQRSWAAARGLEAITWTFDPLVRRNAWFNLVKLRARAEAYYADFYGPMNDGINAGDPTDRCLVVWRLDGAMTRVSAAEPARPALTEGPSGEPVLLDTGSATTVACRIPSDIVEIRRLDPARARAWRLALRGTMGELMNDGYVATSITRDGDYVLVRRPA